MLAMFFIKTILMQLKASVSLFNPWRKRHFIEEHSGLFS